MFHPNHSCSPQCCSVLCKNRCDLNQKHLFLYLEWRIGNVGTIRRFDLTRLRALDSCPEHSLAPEPDNDLA